MKAFIEYVVKALGDYPEQVEIREGQVLTLSRRRAHNLAEHGIVDMLDASG